MSLYMETTKISAERTAGEIQQLLAQSGASQIVTEYDRQTREITALRWTMEIYGQTIPFAMPARVEPVYEVLLRRISPRNRNRKEDQVIDQAKRVAWRQLLRWVQAQLAMIETGMVRPEEVFMPYISISTGKTLYQQLAETKFKALPAPE